MKYVIWSSDEESPPYTRAALIRAVKLGKVPPDAPARESPTRRWRRVADFINSEPGSDSTKKPLYVVWQRGHESPPLTIAQLQTAIFHKKVRPTNFARHGDLYDWTLLLDM